MDRINQGPLGADSGAGNPDEASGHGEGDRIVSAADHGESDQSKRRLSRDSLLLIAQIRIGAAPAVHEVRVRNLSEGGLMIEFERALAVDTPVTLDMRGVGEITGRVAWCTEGRLGIALDAPIDPKKARKPVGQGAMTPTFAKPIVFRAPRAR